MSLENCRYGALDVAVCGCPRTNADTHGGPSCPFELTGPPLSAGPQIFPLVPGPLDSRFHPFPLFQSTATLPTAAWARISLIVESPRAHVFPLPQAPPTAPIPGAWSAR